MVEEPEDRPPTKKRKRPEPTKNKEWFWTLFGGAIIGTIGLLLGIILSNLTTSINVVRSEVQQISEKMAASEARKETYREKSAEMEKTVKRLEDAIAALEQQKEVAKEKMAGIEKSIQGLQDTNKEIRAEVKSVNDKITAVPAQPVLAPTQPTLPK